jgi:hypothetical protein
MTVCLLFFSFISVGLRVDGCLIGWLFLSTLGVEVCLIWMMWELWQNHLLLMMKIWCLINLQIVFSLQQAREELHQVKEDLAAALAHTDQVTFQYLSGLASYILLHTTLFIIGSLRVMF